MKKLWNILVLALAINFVALVAGVGYLYQSKRLDLYNAVGLVMAHSAFDGALDKTLG